MEYLALAVIFYFILRTMGNLVRLLGGSEGSPSEDEPREEPTSRPSGWKGPSPREQTGTAREEPTFWGEDIEEARWREIEDGSTSPHNAPG